ncbi:hypothetical protein [Shimia sp. Alg240-R146]|uniref:hypothetical protein n=1 Tax=Shimia sp. Alg240-R146 TaxID=2993449 RepID=UPI0022DF3234|nr:hypothetical protein [Shimia sp. Alg240-R146]
MINDINNQAFITSAFKHEVHDFQGQSLDVIESNGNLWLSGSAIAKQLGFRPHNGSFSRTLARLSEYDAIKIAETPFKFTDGRRNRGLLVSPRGIVDLVDTAHRDGYNQIKSNDFIAWMQATLFKGYTGANHWSPAAPEKVTLEPVFREAEGKSSNFTADEAEEYRRAERTAMRRLSPLPLADDEVEFTYYGKYRLTGMPRLDLPEDYSSLIDEKDPWMILRLHPA